MQDMSMQTLLKNGLVSNLDNCFEKLRVVTEDIIRRVLKLNDNNGIEKFDQ